MDLLESILEITMQETDTCWLTPEYANIIKNQDTIRYVFHFVCVSLYMCVCVRVFMCSCIHVRVYMSIYVCVYMCVCECVRLFISVGVGGDISHILERSFMFQTSCALIFIFLPCYDHAFHHISFFPSSFFFSQTRI